MRNAEAKLFLYSARVHTYPRTGFSYLHAERHVVDKRGRGPGNRGLHSAR